VIVTGTTGSAAGDLSSFAADYTTSGCGLLAPGADAVYRVVAPSSGTMLARVTPSGFDAVVHIRTVCLDVVSQIACTDASGLNGTEFSSAPVTAGTEYFVIVDSLNTGAGPYTLSLSF
jgi:hypothetical protein